MLKKELKQTLIFFSVSMLLLGMISCAQSIPEVRSVSASVVFDYLDDESLPEYRLAVYVETISNVRRSTDMEIYSLSNDYEWHVIEPGKIQLSDRMYAGTSELAVPEDEKIPNGKYEVVYKEMDGDTIETIFTINCEDEFYEALAPQIPDIMRAKSGRKHIMVYDKDGILLYFGERTSDLSDSRKIWERFRNADSFNDVWIKANGSVICVMPSQKVNPEN